MSQQTFNIWLKGIAIAFIVSAIDGLTNCLIAPESFNLRTTGGIETILLSILIKGATGVRLYMLKSPFTQYPTITSSNNSTEKENK